MVQLLTGPRDVCLFQNIKTIPLVHPASIQWILTTIKYFSLYNYYMDMTSYHNLAMVCSIK